MTTMNQLETWLAQEREQGKRHDAGAGPGVATAACLVFDLPPAR